MNKWIRWQGLIGFTVVVTGLALFLLLFADSIIKRGIEYSGTQMAGARVDLDKAEFRFSPLGLKLTRLQVTNPEQPMQNIIEVQTIDFNMDGQLLLRRKVAIQEMRIDGMRFDTPRSRSGALKRDKKPQADNRKQTNAKPDVVKMPDIAIPEVDKILAREEIKTLKQAEDLKTRIKTGRQNWETIHDRLPGEKRVAEHDAALDKLKATDTKDPRQLLSALEALKQLKNAIKSDIKTVDASYNQVKGNLDTLQQDMAALQNSPQEEFKRLSGKYAVSPTGIGNISHLLFGGEARRYSRMAMDWYQKLEPYLAYVDFSSDKEPVVDRHRGIDIRFKEHLPSADFSVKLAHVSIETPHGNFSGRINDFSSEQNITRKATTLQFSGEKMQGIGIIQLNGRFDHINPARVNDQLNFKMTGYALNKYRLIDKEDMTIYLDRAKSDITVIARRDNDRIQADFRSHVHSIAYNNRASGNELAMMFLSSVNKTRDFNIHGRLRGTFDDYSTEVSSDLDNRLKANMQQHAARRMAEFNKKLNNEIQAKTRQPVQEAQGKLKELSSMVKNDIALRKARLTQQFNQAKEELAHKEQQQKSQIKSKFKNKLKGLKDRFR